MQFENVTCPHCGILCDDVVIEVNDSVIKPLNVNHPHCSKAYADASVEKGEAFSPMVDGKETSLDHAVEIAAALLKSASQPLVSGLIADVQACREAVALTEKVNGVIDHANGTLIRPNIAVMQRIGKVKTTLAEVRNRADNVLIFGSEIFNQFPRLLERVLLPKETLGPESTINKTITVIDSLNEASQQDINHPNVNHIRLESPSLDTAIQTLQRIVHGNLDHSEHHDSATTTLIDIYKTILDSNYTTFVWSTSLLDSNYAEQTIQTITETLKSLMKDHRCVGLPLGGSKGEITASQVVTWQTGVPLPVSFATGVPVHEPLLYNGKTMLENNEADCLVWVATYSPDNVVPETDIPTIVIGHPKMQANKQASVFIPVGIPGVDRRGLVCRADSVATLPLRKIRDIELPNADTVLHKITQML